MRFKSLFLILISVLQLAPLRHVQAQDETTDLFNRVNTLRASLGIYPYNWNAALVAAAQEQAQWLVDNGDITHIHPDGSSPRSRAAAAGYPTPDVSENIYGGTSAGPDDAWQFWLNSPIHYQGMTNTRLVDIGVGAAHGSWGAAYVLVFGNPGVAAPAVASSNDNSGSASSSDNAQPAAPQQPSYVVGVDEHGNIEHQVQPGDTLGDILLIYGYTWADLPYIMQLNGLTDVRDLKEGSIILIPPKAGTYTPTPGGPPPTETPSPMEAVTEQAVLDAPTPTLLPSLTPQGAAQDSVQPVMLVATAASIPNSMSTPTLNPTVIAAIATKVAEIAAAPTTSSLAAAPAAAAPLAATAVNTAPRSSSASPWLVIALVVQIGVLIGAGYEFIRRLRTKR